MIKMMILLFLLSLYIVCNILLKEDHISIIKTKIGKKTEGEDH